MWTLPLLGFMTFAVELKARPSLQLFVSSSTTYARLFVAVSRKFMSWQFLLEHVLPAPMSFCLQLLTGANLPDVSVVEQAGIFIRRLKVSASQSYPLFLLGLLADVTRVRHGHRVVRADHVWRRRVQRDELLLVHRADSFGLQVKPVCLVEPLRPIRVKLAVRSTAQQSDKRMD